MAGAKERPLHGEFLHDLLFRSMGDKKQAEYAEQIGIAAETLSRWLNKGPSHPNKQDLGRAAKIICERGNFDENTSRIDISNSYTYLRLKSEGQSVSPTDLPDIGRLWLEKRSPVPSVRSPKQLLSKVIPTVSAIGELVPARATIGITSEHVDYHVDYEGHVNGIDAQKHMLGWARGPNKHALFILLGEYGMGKTVNCQFLARQLLLMRQEAEPFDRQPPFPIYLDLRLARGFFQSSATSQTTRRFDMPDIDRLLDAVLQDGSASIDTANASDVHELIRSGNVAIIWDGFDEIAVQLHPDEAKDLFRRMWSLLPRKLPEKNDDEPEDAAKQAGMVTERMLISCRTHYFQTVSDVLGLFDNRSRLDLTQSFDKEPVNYDSLVLLPFDGDQILTFLESQIGDTGKAERALETICEIHNLRELSERPVLLKQIFPHLEAIEERAAQGEAINSVRLYEILSDFWFQREGRKHTIDVDNKRVLMGRLAGAIWKSGEKNWPYDRVNEWLDEQLRSDDRLKDRYGELFKGKAREILFGDLRTCSFVVRENEGDFRFAHTSIQEYFLSRQLFLTMFHGLSDNCEWSMQMPTKETLDFLTEEAIENPRAPQKERFINNLREFLQSSYVKEASEIAFRLALNLQERDEPLAPIQGFKLRGANLEGWSINGNLMARESDFSNANIKASMIEGVDVSGSDFSQANLSNVIFCRSDLSKANFQDAEIMGSIFRYCELNDAKIDKAIGYPGQVIHCSSLSSTQLAVFQKDGSAIASKDTPNGMLQENKPRKLRNESKTQCQITSILFNKCGNAILFGAQDGTVRQWDIYSWQEAYCLKAHQGGTAAILRVDGTSQIASVGTNHNGQDEMVLLDLECGEIIHRIEGAYCRPTTTATSPDGSCILTTNDDRTIDLWERQLAREEKYHSTQRSSRPVLPELAKQDLTMEHCAVVLINTVTNRVETRFVGHQKPVSNLAFSDDGQLIASCSHDQSVRVWDRTSGNQLAEFYGHQGTITSVTFSPNGKLIASGGHDGTVRLWDVTAKQELARNHIMPNGGAVPLRASDDTILCMTEKAWRHFRWEQNTGETTLQNQLLPLEAAPESLLL